MLDKLPPAGQLSHPECLHLGYGGSVVVPEENCHRYFTNIIYNLQRRKVVRSKSFQCLVSKFSYHMCAILLVIPGDYF